MLLAPAAKHVCSMRNTLLALGQAGVEPVLKSTAPAVLPRLHRFLCRKDRCSRLHASCSYPTGRRGLSCSASEVSITMASALGAYVPTVDVSKYEEQLAAKTQKLQAVLRELGPLPEIEVCPSVQQWIQLQRPLRSS
jgi:hypothetical protein